MSILGNHPGVHKAPPSPVPDAQFTLVHCDPNLASQACASHSRVYLASQIRSSQPTFLCIQAPEYWTSSFPASAPGRSGQIPWLPVFKMSTHVPHARESSCDCSPKATKQPLSTETQDQPHLHGFGFGPFLEHSSSRQSSVLP